MNTVVEIGAFEAKTHLPALLRKVGEGAVFHVIRRYPVVLF
jgi:antitoxin (DNA-binding transcriptional repressor) of toxin-antitoxin stability system